MTDKEIVDKVVKLSKDQERIKVAFEAVESLESLVFYRGKDSTNPRIVILNLLQEMHRTTLREFSNLEFDE